MPTSNLECILTIFSCNSPLKLIGICQTVLKGFCMKNGENALQIAGGHGFYRMSHTIGCHSHIVDGVDLIIGG